MDKKAWIAVTLSIIGIIAWQVYYTQQLAPPAVPPAAPAAPVATAPSPEAAAAPSAAPTPAIPAAEIKATPATIPVTAELAKESIEPVNNGGTEIRFTNRGGGIASVKLLDPQHTDARGGRIQLNEHGGLPIGSLVEKPGDVEQANAAYEMRKEGDVFVFERVTKDGLKITKRFKPAAAGAKETSLTELEITFSNVGTAKYRDDGLYLHTGSVGPIHASDMPTYTGFDWLKDTSHSETTVSYFDASSFLGFFKFSEAKTLYRENAERLMWAGVKNQFYATIVTGIVGDKPTDQMAVRGVWANRFPVPWPDNTPQNASSPVYGIAGAIGLPALKLEPGASQTLKFQIYTGPRSYERLKALGRGEEEMMNFGMFKIVSVFLLSSMSLLKGWLGNYALAIIVLTVLIKAALWPLQSKAIKAQKKMALLAPKMKELQEKFKDDPTKLNIEVMQMYKDYGVSPVGGCLPMVAQMPIFFGFYNMLGTAVELRNSSFLWAKDLTQPDTIAMVFGIPINPLPVLMAATMFWQMAITPKTGDPKQQRIFMLMPLMFVFFCYNFASALALYWTVQNLLSVLQTYLTRHQPLPDLVKRGPDGEKAAKARVVAGPGGAKRKAAR